MLIVLGSLLVGGIVGSLLRLEAARGGRSAAGCSDGCPPGAGSAERHRFIEGFVTSSLVLLHRSADDPRLAVNDGLGHGADQLFLKAALDGFAAIAFAASFGWGVAASAVTVVVVQGGLTLVGVAARRRAARGRTLAALTATGGLLLVGRRAAAAADPARSRSPTCCRRCSSHRCWSPALVASPDLAARARVHAIVRRATRPRCSNRRTADCRDDAMRPAVAERLAARVA